MGQSEVAQWSQVELRTGAFHACVSTYLVTWSMVAANLPTAVPRTSNAFARNKSQKQNIFASFL